MTKRTLFTKMVLATALLSVLLQGIPVLSQGDGSSPPLPNTGYTPPILARPISKEENLRRLDAILALAKKGEKHINMGDCSFYVPDLQAFRKYLTGDNNAIGLNTGGIAPMSTTGYFAK